MKAVISAVERYLINYWALPNRATTAMCDACDGSDHRSSGTREDACAQFEASGWLIEACAPGAACLCPPCVSMIWAQLA